MPARALPRRTPIAQQFDPRLVERFEARQRVQGVVVTLGVLCLGFSVVPFFFNFLPIWLVPIGMAGLVGTLIYSAIVWRCPACDAQLGLKVNHRHCPACREKFYKTTPKINLPTHPRSTTPTADPEETVGTPKQRA